MIRTTRWSPDTCGCVVEYTWDDTVPDDQRTHTFSRFVTICSAHQGLANHAARWDALNDENPKKNLVKDHLLNNFPAIAQTVLNMDGSSYLDFKAGITVSFGQNFSGKGRVLVITIPQLTAAQKAAVQTAVDNRFGAGRVTIA